MFWGRYYTSELIIDVCLRTLKYLPLKTVIKTTRSNHTAKDGLQKLGLSQEKLILSFFYLC